MNAIQGTGAGESSNNPSVTPAFATCVVSKDTNASNDSVSNNNTVDELARWKAMVGTGGLMRCAVSANSFVI